MARDRLAAIRAQQSGASQDPYSDPYQQSAPQQSRNYYDSDRPTPDSGGYGQPQRSYSSDERRGPSESRQPPPRQPAQGLPTGGPRPQAGSRRPTNPPPAQQRAGETPGRAYGGDAYAQSGEDGYGGVRGGRAKSAGGQGGGARYPQQQQQQDYGRSRTPPAPQQDYNRSRTPPARGNGRTLAAGGYGEGDGSDLAYGYEEKGGSTVNLVDKEERYEMRPRNGGAQSGGNGGGGGRRKAGGKTIRKGDVEYEEMGEFFSEISSLQDGLRDATASITQIQTLHTRMLSLPSSDDPSAIALSSNLATLTSSTRTHLSSLKNRIQALAQGNANLRALIPVGQSVHNLSLSDVDVRQSQVEALKERFKEAVQRYAQVERESRSKNRNRMERQVRIVNPDLNEQEIAGVVKQAEEGGGGGALFQQALQSNGQRTGAARGALREVQSRAAELARIENTLTQLAQLFNDMAMLVEAQDIQIMQVEANGEMVAQDMEKGMLETKKAVVSARGSRKKRWWCFGILMVILIFAAVIVVVQVILPMIKRNEAAAEAEAKASAASSRSVAATAVRTTVARTSEAATAANALAVVRTTGLNTLSIPTTLSYTSGHGNGEFVVPTARARRRDGHFGAR